MDWPTGRERWRTLDFEPPGMKYTSFLSVVALVSLYGCAPTTTPNTSSPTPKATAAVQTPKSTTTPQASNPSPMASPVNGQEFLIVAGKSIGAANQSSDKESLTAHYGADAVSDVSVYVGEGMELPGLALFADDPKKTVELAWSEEKPKKLLLIRIEGDESVWETQDGVTLGTSLVELEKLNGGPFQFTGLEWDLGGWVSDWKGGKLDGLTARFGSTDGTKMSEEDLKAIVGDIQVSSSSEAAQRINPRLNQISINF